MRNLKRLLLNSLLVSLAAGVSWPDVMTGGNYVVTKDLLGATGSTAMGNANYDLAFAWGEPISGDLSVEVSLQLVSGYYGGRFGNWQTFTMVSSQVGQPGAKTFFQDRFQVGVPFDAPIQINFSDQVDKNTAADGIVVSVAADHLGHASDEKAPFAVTPDAPNDAVTLVPNPAWTGNTLYDVQVTPKVSSVDGFPLNQVYHLYFLTMLDHHQDNVVLDPIAPAAAQAPGPSSVGAMSIDIPKESLSNYSTVLLSRDPLTSPLRADPKIIQEANDKARAAGGPYRVPISIQEVSAYDASGNLMGRLSKPAQVSIDYGAELTGPGATGRLVRPQTLSLWILDEAHRLWVKIPASQQAAGFHTVTAPVSQLSVFALMGSSDATASDSFAFPVPWRPHGPNAGPGTGQTGTESGGITFSSIPPECTIKIYTIAGELVRELRHSDLAGTPSQEKWDVKTSGGDSVASGVYLWRVESSVDGKSGKLMVIR